MQRAGNHPHPYLAYFCQRSSAHHKMHYGCSSYVIVCKSARLILVSTIRHIKKSIVCATGVFILTSFSCIFGLFDDRDLTHHKIHCYCKSYVIVLKNIWHIMASAVWRIIKSTFVLQLACNRPQDHLAYFD